MWAPVGPSLSLLEGTLCAPTGCDPPAMLQAPPRCVCLLTALLCLLGLSPLATAAKRVQVYGFAVATTPTYKHYNWSVLTTAAWRTDPELVSLAQRHGAVVELNAGDVSKVMASPDKRKAWVQAQLVKMVQTGARGINFDLEAPAQPGSQAAADYTALVSLMATEAHTALPGSQVSVDVPWSPYDIDGRNYDWLGLAAAADLLFVMMYDTQSQILGRCIASANSPLDTVKKGVQQWLDLGVPPHKLVLGLPWYGYDYPCVGAAPGKSADAGVDVCRLQAVPFRGVSCSDAAGAQKCYSEVMSFLSKGLNTTDVRWDDTQHSPYFNYRAADGLIHQVWFDDPRSLAAKYKVAAEAGLAGIGMWNLDCLDYLSTNPGVQQQTAEMWKAVQAAVSSWKQQQGQHKAAGRSLGAAASAMH